MSIIMRSYSASDRQRVIDFRRACTTLENVYDYPTVIDLYELLDTSAAHGTTRTGIWEDENGDIVAFAIPALQDCNCYFLISPHISHHEIERGILNWAEHQIRETEHCTAIDTPCRDTDIERVALLERQGFVRNKLSLITRRFLWEKFLPAWPYRLTVL